MTPTIKMRSPDGEIGNVNLKNVKEALNYGFELVGQEEVKIRSPWGDEGLVPYEKVKDALNYGGQLVIEPSAFFKVFNPHDGKSGIVPANRLREALNDGLELVNEANISDYAQAFTGGIIKNLVQVTDVVTNLIQQPEKTNLSDNNKQSISKAITHTTKNLFGKYGQIEKGLEYLPSIRFVSDYGFAILLLSIILFLKKNTIFYILKTIALPNITNYFLRLRNIITKPIFIQTLYKWGKIFYIIGIVFSFLLSSAVLIIDTALGIKIFVLVGILFYIVIPRIKKLVSG
jgi:hypothetical protein